MNFDLPFWVAVLIWLSAGASAVLAGILLSLGLTWLFRLSRRHGRKAGV